MALVDDILTSINATLAANLSWLDNTYGKVQKLQRKNVDGKIIRYPGVYIGSDMDNYISLLPDGHLGNYTYFEIDDPVDYGNIDRHIQPRFGFKLVVWFHWPDLYADWRDREIEEVKAQVLNVLVASPYTRSGENFRIAESAGEIYRGYTHQEIDNHFLERPYGGFSIEGEVIAAAACSLDLVTPTLPLNLFGLIPASYSTSEQVFPLLKWLSNTPIYWRTWALGSGADDYEELTGLSVDEVGVILHSSSHTSRNTVSGTWTTINVAIEENGSGGYKVFTLPFTDNNYITLFYTKA